MTKRHNTLIWTALVVILAIVILQARFAARLRDENKKLLVKQTRLSRDYAIGLSDLEAKSKEISWLRSQVAALRPASHASPERDQPERQRNEPTGKSKQESVAWTDSSSTEPIVNGISFTGNTQFSDTELAEILVSKTGEGLDKQKLDADIVEIWKKYREAGHTGIVVRAAQETDNISGHMKVTFTLGETVGK